MDTISKSVLSELGSKKQEILSETTRKKQVILENPSRLADPNDRATANEVARQVRLSLERLKKKIQAIEYLMDLLEGGWDMTCTRCEVTPLSSERVTDHLTSLCVDCKSELEIQEKRKGNRCVYQ